MGIEELIDLMWSLGVILGPCLAKWTESKLCSVTEQMLCGVGEGWTEAHSVQCFQSGPSGM